MTDNTPLEHGTVMWTELMTRTPRVVMDYYTALYGWQFDLVETNDARPEHYQPPYYMGKLDGNPVIGVMDMGTSPEFEETPPHWFTYFSVKDIAAAVATTVERGGSIRRPPFVVPGVGQIAIIADPEGAVFGVCQADAH